MGKATIIIEAQCGGDETQACALMLYQMYVRWSLKQGYWVRIKHIDIGERAGIKSAVLAIEGENAHKLRGECGVHRFVRISPFDPQSRRHTSFVKVATDPYDTIPSGESTYNHQIRSYVFHPYKLAKDHRTDAETTDIEGVMGGDIDIYIAAAEHARRHATKTRE